MHSGGPTRFGTGTTDPRVISNSSMWQSERWNRAVTKISADDGFAGAALLALQLFHQRRYHDVVYTVGVRQAQMYGLLCACVGTGGKPHVATEILLDKVRAGSRVWGIKRALRRFAFRQTAKIIVFSEGERALYSRELQLPLERVHFVPFHTNIQQPRFTAPGSYGFAAGRSLRDYKTFFAAVAKVNFAFVVVADRASVANLRKPDNVELYCDVPRARYLELLEGARFAVVPLEAEYRSTGQVVVLEAASLGKPVIASDVMGVRDYISHRVDGLLVAPGNPEALRSAIQSLIGDDALGQKLARSAMRRVARDHSFPTFAAECLDVMRQACVQSARSEFQALPEIADFPPQSLQEPSLAEKS